VVPSGSRVMLVVWLVSNFLPGTSFATSDSPSARTFQVRALPLAAQAEVPAVGGPRQRGVPCPRHPCCADSLPFPRPKTYDGVRGLPSVVQPFGAENFSSRGPPQQAVGLTRREVEHAHEQGRRRWGLDSNTRASKWPRSRRATRWRTCRSPSTTCSWCLGRSVPNSNHSYGKGANSCKMWNT
jgi:hypothetical protein